MKKGLIFIVLAAMLYWGYFYIKRITPKKPIITGEEIIVPVQKAEKMVRKSNLSMLETSIIIFKQSEGRYPIRLQELVEKGYLSKIPDPGGIMWEYNQQDGSVK